MSLQLLKAGTSDALALNGISNRVYPVSIATGTQDGDIYVDTVY